MTASINYAALFEIIGEALSYAKTNAMLGIKGALSEDDVDQARALADRLILGQGPENVEQARLAIRLIDRDYYRKGIEKAKSFKILRAEFLSKFPEAAES